jgi:uncharacterized BrkB/YihY/UPF0761 family membrane protein
MGALAVSGAMLVAVAIVIVSSIAIVAVGAIYKWDVTAPGYALWTRIIGVAAVVGLTTVVAWGKRDDPLSAVLIFVGGIGLAVGFVVAHRNLTRSVRSALDDTGSGETGKEDDAQPPR